MGRPVTGDEQGRCSRGGRVSPARGCPHGNLAETGTVPACEDDGITQEDGAVETRGPAAGRPGSAASLRPSRQQLSAPESERPGQWTPAPSAYQVSLPLVRVRGAQAGGGAGGLPRATQRVGDRRASPRHAEGAAEAGRHPAAGVLVRAANGSEGEEAWPLAFCRPRRYGGLRVFPAIVSGAGVQSRPAGFSRARRLTFKFLSPRHSAEMHAGQEGVLFGGWS